MNRSHPSPLARTVMRRDCFSVGPHIRFAPLARYLLALAASNPLQAAAVTYDDVSPILQARCITCHASTAAPLSLSLDNYDALIKGSSRGPVVNSGAPADSEPIRRIRGTSKPRMPMTGPPFLTDAEIATFERWIADGLAKGENRPIVNSSAGPHERPVVGEPVTYRRVTPIFATRCAKCHTDTGLMGPAPEGYVLTSYESTLTTSDRARIVPDQPGASELMRRIRGHARPRMPFDGPPDLSDDEAKLIEDWITHGARDSNATRAKLPSATRVRLHGTLGPAWLLLRTEN